MMDLTLAREWFEVIWRASWQGGIALLAAWAICTIWRSLPARAKCWVWRIAYLKLLTAVVWMAPVRLPVLRPARAEAGPVVNVSPVVAHHLILNPAHTASSAAPSPAMSWLDRWPTYLMLLWGMGVLIGMTRLGRQWRWAVRLRRESNRVQDLELRDVLHRVAKRTGFSRMPMILVCERLAGPLLVGLVRPAIVLPRSILDGRRDRLEMVLAHEMAHLRRGDLWWNLLAAAGDLFFFYHPLVWPAHRRFRLAQEMACDQLVLDSTSCRPADYATTLLEIAHPTAAATFALASGVAGSGKSLHKRITAMKNQTHWSKQRWFIAVAVAGLVCVLGIPPWRVVAQERVDTGAGQAKPNAQAGQTTVVQRLRDRREQEAAGDGGSFIGVVVAARVEISPGVDGVVRKVNVHEGDHVKAGQELIELDGRRARAGVVEAEAKLAQAEANLKRSAAMRQAGQPGDIESAQAEVQIAKAELELRMVDLDETRLSAPFDGVMAQVRAVPGQRVAKNKSLAAVVEEGKLRITFTVAQTIIRDIRIGQKLELRAQSFPGQSFEGQVRSISPVVDGPTGMVGVEAELTGAAGGLMSGIMVEVKMAGGAK